MYVQVRHVTHISPCKLDTNDTVLGTVMPSPADIRLNPDNGS